MDKNSDSIFEEVVELYPFAKEAVLFFETREKKKSLAAIIDLRDCLDHLMISFLCKDDRHKRESELNNALEHLRRASNEPLELAVENKLYLVLERKKWHSFSKFFLVSTPSRAAVNDLITRTQEELQNARSCKNRMKWQDGLKHLKHAYNLVCDIDKLIPEKEIWLGRLFTLLIAILFLVLGMLIK